MLALPLAFRRLAVLALSLAPAACRTPEPSAPAARASPESRADAPPSAAAAELLQAITDGMEQMQLASAAGRGDFRPDPDVEWRAAWSLRLARAQVLARTKSAADAAREHAARIAADLAETEELYAAGRRVRADVTVLRVHAAEAKLLVERAVATGSLRGD
jgi:hypothetical protein